MKLLPIQTWPAVLPDGMSPEEAANKIHEKGGCGVSVSFDNRKKPFAVFRVQGKLKDWIMALGTLNGVRILNELPPIPLTAEKEKGHDTTNGIIVARAEPPIGCTLAETIAAVECAFDRLHCTVIEQSGAACDFLVQMHVGQNVDTVRQSIALLGIRLLPDADTAIFVARSEAPGINSM